MHTYFSNICMNLCCTPLNVVLNTMNKARTTQTLKTAKNLRNNRHILKTKQSSATTLVCLSRHTFMYIAQYLCIYVFMYLCIYFAILLFSWLSRKQELKLTLGIFFHLSAFFAVFNLLYIIQVHI